MNKRILVAVDLQNDFIDGSLGTKEAEAIVEPAAARIEAAKAAGDLVIATMDTHQEDYLDTREGRFLPVVHCVENTPGWQLNPRIAKALEGCVVVAKPTFGSTELPGLIENVFEEIGDGKGFEIELIGLCTDICVVSNALILKAAFPEAELKAASGCCAGVTPEKHEAALETMRSCQIVVE